MFLSQRTKEIRAVQEDFLVFASRNPGKISKSQENSPLVDDVREVIILKSITMAFFSVKRDGMSDLLSKGIFLTLPKTQPS